MDSADLPFPCLRIRSCYNSVGEMPTTTAHVDWTHQDYDDNKDKWEIVADVLQGEDAVKAAGSKYLPTFEDTETEEWEKYKKRADFFEITGRALTAMIGFLFRRDPRLEAPGVEPDDPDSGVENTQLDAFLGDATLTGKDFYDVAKDCARLMAVSKGRGGLLIDWSMSENHCFVNSYLAEDIINWRFERVHGRLKLTLVVLHEQALVDEDEFKTSYEDRWRELRLVGDPEEGYSTEVKVWRKKQQKGSAQKPEFEQVGPTLVPMRGKEPLSEIPFVFVTPDGNHGEYVAAPPLLPMARLNLSLYRTNADQENALHVLGMPTPWAAGFNDEDEKLYLGSTRAWTTDDPSARCGFLALQGSDLQPLSDGEKAKMDKMAMLGARMLDPNFMQGRTPEAYATVALRQTGETASLVDISLGLSQSLSDVLAWVLWWSSNLPDVTAAKETVSYTVNTDFVGSSLDAPLVSAIFQLYLQRGISFETLFQKLQGGEIIPADRTVEQEKELINKGENLLLGMGLMSAFGRQPNDIQQQTNNPKEKQNETENT